MEPMNETLAAKRIAEGLPTDWPGEIRVFDTLPSTNTYLADNAASLPDRSAVLALAQSAGRGRMGHAFSSPAGAGLYMSFLLKEDLPTALLPLVTPYAAVIAAETAERLCAARSPAAPVPTVGIKWVNDLFLQGKKVCGILTEGFFKPDGTFSHAVIGIGFNLLSGRLPAGLSEIAGALGDFCPAVPDGTELAAGLLSAFFDGIPRLYDRSFLDAYRRRSVLMGREVHYVQNGKPCAGIVCGIDGDAGLIVSADGEKTVLRAGEISVRI